jgi:hypothetical protein
MPETEYLLYQTLEDRGNYEENENEGPYPCSWNNTWLGEGYYYWYHHIKLAHWWGAVRYKGNKYVIFESVCKDLSRCWDLHLGKGQDLFLYWLNKMQEEGLLNAKTSVAQVIEFVKNEYPDFPYSGIRILGMDSISLTSISNLGFVRMNFEFPIQDNVSKMQKYRAYFDPMPPVQVCLFEKNGLGRVGYKLVFPEDLIKENRELNIFI